MQVSINWDRSAATEVRKRAGARVVVLGGRTNILECARSLGVDAVLVHRPGGYEPVAERLCERIVHADFADHQALLAALAPLHADRPFARILSLTEDGLVPAARLNEAFGLGGNSLASVLLLKDKAAMRRRLAERGLSPVRTRVVRGLADTHAFLAEIGDSIILKPIHGAGSVGVSRIDTPAAAAAAWAVLADGHPMLAEEYLYGVEISVEAFSARGRHTVVGFTDKTLAGGFVEVGHTMPARVDEAAKLEAARLVVAFLDAAGLREGPSHTEVMLTRYGPRIIESHNRIGGGSLRELVRLAYGVDLARLTVAAPLGLEPPPAVSPAPLGGAAVRFFTPAPGAVTAIEGVDAFASDPDVSINLTCGVGDVVPPLRTSYDRTAGFVIGRGPDAEAAVRQCDAALAGIRITTA